MDNGYFGTTPKKVYFKNWWTRKKSKTPKSVTLTQRLTTRKIHFGDFLRDHQRLYFLSFDWTLVDQLKNNFLHVDDILVFGEFVTTVKIDVLPSDKWYPFQLSDSLCIATVLLVSEQGWKNCGVVEDNTVGDQATTFLPNLLLKLGFKTQFSEIRKCYSLTQLIVTLAAIERQLDIAA